MSDTPNKDEIAASIFKELQQHPELLIGQLAARFEVSELLIVEILDSYKVVDGAPVHVGSGLGGEWIPTELQAAIPIPESRGEDIGNRWPDDSLRPEAFNIQDPEHRAEMGIELPSILNAGGEE